MTDPLLVVDAPSVLYRAFFALPASIRGTDDAPVNALLGSCNLLLGAIAEHPARAVVCCFGPDAAPYRVARYAGYHAQRPPMPDELAAQWGRAPALFNAFGWTVAEDPELEADDLLGAYAAVEERGGGRADLLTGDRDLFQCVTDRVRVLYLVSGRSGPEVIGPGEVEARYGVPPRLVPDFIALRGDPSDGLPGARGVGEKTAAQLLQRHGSLDGVLDAVRRPLPAERPRIVDALLDAGEQLDAFRDIATLREPRVERPPDAPTDLAGGARAARALGLQRLAQRLEQG